MIEELKDDEVMNIMQYLRKANSEQLHSIIRETEIEINKRYQDYRKI